MIQAYLEPSPTLIGSRRETSAESFLHKKKRLLDLATSDLMSSGLFQEEDEEPKACEFQLGQGGSVLSSPWIVSPPKERLIEPSPLKQEIEDLIVQQREEDEQHQIFEDLEQCRAQLWMEQCQGLPRVIEEEEEEVHGSEQS